MYIMYNIVYIISCLVLVKGETQSDSQKDQFCTDPRTMRKHAAYTEWADAYSCTRHRCQPGGRNLAIYTVGCKRVEAPESAIECEEVVEDTNMQFPYCCTRLRCLVVVRGEVWTRVLGQPWETLPAAPWSHMYKMKKPPPVDGGFEPKEGVAAGPVYELTVPSDGEQVMRARSEKDPDSARASRTAAPDIVIALSSNSEKKPSIADIQSKLRSHRSGFDGDRSDQHNEIYAEETPAITEKVPEIVSEERMYSPDQRQHESHRAPEPVSDEHLSDGEKKTSISQKTWSKLPQEPWSGNADHADAHARPFSNINEFDREHETTPKTVHNKNLLKKSSSVFWKKPQTDQRNRKTTQSMGPRLASSVSYTSSDINKRKSSRRQLNPDQSGLNELRTRISKLKHEMETLTEATQFRAEHSEEKEQPGSLQTLVNAIGSRMRDIETVVQQMSAKVQPPESAERFRATRQKVKTVDNYVPTGKQKKPSDENYNRFPAQGGNKYLRNAEGTTEPPLLAQDTHMEGYYSEPNLRRSNVAMEPETYMVPVDVGHKKTPETDEHTNMKHKKHAHKKRKLKHGKRKHHTEDRGEKQFNKTPADHVDKNAVSSEDSADLGKA